MADKYLDKTGLGQVWNAATGTFVAQEEGKTLTSNDFTDEMMEKVNNAASASEMETALNAKANADTVYTKEQTYTKEETEQKIKTAVASAYNVKGSILFAELPTEGMVTGDMYNIKEAFTTTDAFLEGAGLSYTAGTNVAYTADGKWDCMAGTYDFSNFLMKDDVGSLTEEDIAAICTMPTV